MNNIKTALRLISYTIPLQIGASYAAITIPEVPLFASAQSAPNLMLIVDDSGSMQWEILPGKFMETGINGQGINHVYPYGNQPMSTFHGGGGWGKEAPLFERSPSDENIYSRAARSHHVNTLYYNPAITYTPWKNKTPTAPYPDADPTCAYHHPNHPGTDENHCRNLTIDNTAYADNWASCSTLSATNFSVSDCTHVSGSKTFYPAVYWSYNGGGVTNTSSYTKVEIKDRIPPYTGDGREERTDCAVNNSCTYTEEIQNFANWYTYYRSRTLLAKAAIGETFSQQDENSLRVGIGRIKAPSTSIDGVDTATIMKGVRQFTGTDRQSFFNTLYNISSAGGTPLRNALKRAGEYYSRSDDGGPWSTDPEARGPLLSCRKSYTMLMTDGYWNGGNPGVSNQDGGPGPTITHADGNETYQYLPNDELSFRDNYSETLADVAMKYWKRDLISTLPNNVKKTNNDVSFWQNMVTFGVGLGVDGSVISAAAAESAIEASDPISWPAVIREQPSTIDDLIHASMNSRGEFFSANNPTEFKNKLSEALLAITNTSQGGANVALNSSNLSSESKIFQGGYNSSKWTGSLRAFSITENGSSSTPVWDINDPNDLIPDQPPIANTRKIFTMSGGTGVSFRWNNLSPTQKSSLGSTDAEGQAVLRYIRGNRNPERQNGGQLRNRAIAVPANATTYGDIINSSPYYAEATDTIYVGANDGMLHAFDAATGKELFNYIPSSLIPKLKQYASPTYTHTFFVDGDIKIATVGTSQRLVGLLGRGGKGLFGLNVTTPSTFDAAKVKWELLDGDDDLGYMLGEPIISTLTGLTTGPKYVVVGNGYNSDNGSAALYIINLKTGVIVNKVVADTSGDNGLATPVIDEVTGNVYAGDLKGNIWMFSNVLASDTVVKVFTAINGDGITQPITGPINLWTDSEGQQILYAGTGSFFKAGDIANTDVQSMYAIQLPNTGLTRSDLKQRTLDTVGSRRTMSEVVDGDMDNAKGWFIDFDNPGDAGERVLYRPNIYNLAVPTLFVTTNIPTDDPCTPKGRSYVNVLDPSTGSHTAVPILDTDGDGDFDDDDKMTNSGGEKVAESGTLFNETWLGEIKIIGNRFTTGGDECPDNNCDSEDPFSNNSGSGGPVNMGGMTGRINWKEIKTQ